MILILLFSNELYSDNCVKRRAFIDLGNVFTNFFVADIDTCKNLIIKIVYSNEHIINFMDNINGKNSPKLNDEIFLNAQKVIFTEINQIISLGAK